MCVQRLRTCTCDICNFVVVLASVIGVRNTNIAGHVVVTFKHVVFGHNVHVAARNQNKNSLKNMC